MYILRSVCSRFNIGKATTALRTVRRVVKTLCEKSSLIIKWPIVEEINIVTQGFNAKGFPNTIGTIDGSHIQIPLPKVHGIFYIIRHNNSSILLQIAGL